MRIGVEIEGFAYKKDNQRADVFSFLGEKKKFLSGIGQIFVDAGIHQIELSLEPVKASEIEKIKLMIESGLSIFPRDWLFFWQGQDPFATENTPPPVAPRGNLFQALKEALFQEVGPVAVGAESMTMWAATQFHYEISPSSPEGVKLINYLTNWAPALAVFFANPYPSRRLTRAWWGWGNMRRQPNYFWFRSEEELRRFWLSIPRLIKEVKEGDWMVDLSQPEFPDPYHEVTIHWFVRPRWTLGTIEFRPLDSLPPNRVVEAGRIFLKVVEKILTAPESELPKVSPQEWWNMIFVQNWFKAEKLVKRIVGIDL